MRTAVVRVGIDPDGQLTPALLDGGMAVLRDLASGAGVSVVERDLVSMPAHRREVELLMIGADPDELMRAAVAMCATAFGVEAAPGVLTYVSRGTDEDARGVLAGFGISGDVIRERGEHDWDVVHVTLRRDDLARVPESRIHTALEASLNCEVRIRTV